MSRRVSAIATALALFAAVAAPAVAHAASPVPTVHRARAPVESAPPAPSHRAQPATPQPVGHIPCDLYNAYHATPTPAVDDGAGQTIAIVDPYDTPTIVSDFAAFSAAFTLGGQPLTKVTADPRGVDLSQSDVAAWTQEIPLGVEWAHALAPGARIVLVEAYTSADTDMIAAIDYAVSQVKPDIVSMSWTFDESGYDKPTITGWDSHFPITNGGGHPVTFVAATGDNGPTPAWPAVSPNVIAVGGTSVTPAGFNGDDTSSHTSCPASPSAPYVNQANETAWSSTGGGVSAFEPKPGYQATARAAMRVTPDVAMLADPNQGVAVYMAGGWSAAVLGGTSLATPMWAALVARLNQIKTSNLYGVGWLYAHYSPGSHVAYNDVNTGSSGTLSAAAGFDELTGMGSPLWNVMPATATAQVISYFPWFDRYSDTGFSNDNIHIVNPNPTDTTVTVTIPGYPGCQSTPTVVHPSKEFVYTCPTGFGGPVTVSASQRVVASQRVQYFQTFNEVAALGPASASTSLVFTWYDRASNAGFQNGSDDVHVVNPGPSPASVAVTIPGCPTPFRTSINAGEAQHFTCAGGFGGPVSVTSDQPVIATQRVKYYGSFNEVSALPSAEADNSLWLSWFDRVSDAGFVGDNVHVYNPTSNPDTNVTVTIPGCPGLPSKAVRAGAEGIFTCAAGYGGPVHVITDNGARVLASQRVQFYQTFNEVPARSIDDDGTPGWLTWYDMASSPGFTGDDVHLVNPGPGGVTYQAFIPGCSFPSSSLQAGKDAYVSCPGGFGGPVRIAADGPLLASARVKYYASFNEVTAST